MRNLLIFCITIFLSVTAAMAQVGNKVTDVNVMNADNRMVSLPMFGEKGLLIFYPDPSHSKQNKNLQDYFKENPINSSKIESYGVVNMAAAPLIPNGLIRKMAVKAIAGTKGQVYFDPDNALSKGWKLGDVNDVSCVIIVSKEKIIEFFKAGQVTDEEMQKVIDWVKNNR